MKQQLQFTSKLNNLPESIFSTMSGLAQEYRAINLSQGFPNYPTSALLQELVTKAMKDGHNQYAPLRGDLGLREVIAEKIEREHKAAYHPDKEITITVGASQALFNAFHAFVNSGDEIIVFKPAFDTYEPSIKLNGGIPICIQLEHPHYHINWQEVKNKISEKTKMIVINTPHNPSGTLLSQEDLNQLAQITENTNIIVLSDEVYDHMTFDGTPHLSICSHSQLKDRSIVCCSFGKTFHNTGWKVGYCTAPDYIMEEIVKVHEQNTYCVIHPLQKAFATFIKDEINYNYLNDFFQAKRDLFLNGLSGSKFRFTPSKGTYFQLLEYDAITNEHDVELAKKWTKELGVASIPISVFNVNNYDPKVLRFCFAKTNETIKRATEILCQIQ